MDQGIEECFQVATDVRSGGVCVFALQDTLQWARDLSILDWQGFQPGAFGGSADALRTVQFNKLFKVPHIS